MPLTTAIIFTGMVISALIIGLTVLSPFQHKNLRYGVVGYFSCLGIISAEHFVEYSGNACAYPFTIFMSAVCYLLLIPFLHVMINSIFNRPVLWRKFMLEAIPAFAYLILMIPFYILSGEEKCRYLTRYIDIEGQESFKHLVLIWVLIVQTLIYAVIWYKTIREYTRAVKTSTSSGDIEFMPWVSGLLAVIVLFTSSVFITWLARLYEPENYYVLDKSENIVLSFIPSVFLFLLFLLPERPFPGLDRSRNESSENQDKGHSMSHVDQLKKLMEQDKLYLNADLSLSDVADHMNLSRHSLSNLLSQGLQQNFYDFVNDYRITYAKELMDSDMIKAFSLSGIARESGFNNYVSFYRVFKRLTRMTPSAYLEQSGAE